MLIKSSLIIASVCVIVASSSGQHVPVPDYLTEGRAFDWGSQAEQGNVWLADDAWRARVGSFSLRMETDGGFDTWMWTPRARSANWDFGAARSGGLRFWVFAENRNIGFQNRSPWIRLHSSPNDYLELRPVFDLLNDARDRWIEMRIPLQGDATWTRRRVGSPDLRRVNAIEFHADTWEYGFKVWLDGLRFDEPIAPPANQRAYAGSNQVGLSWQRFDDMYGGVLGYRVYRSTSPFTRIDGLQPIATIPNLAQTSYVDGEVRDGTTYHYAVTVAFQDGFETREVRSIPGRTPYSESDLQITAVARTPRYPRYDVQYRDFLVTEPSGFGPYVFSGAVGLGGGQNESTQRWPRNGDPVTYTATVRNRGTLAWAGFLPFKWFVDGALAASDGRFVNLSPGQTATFPFVLPWDGRWRKIEGRLEIADARPSNNQREIWTKSVAFLTYVDRTFIEDFREDTPNFPRAVTNDAIDWLHHHMDQFNQLFLARSSPKRVHWDVLSVTADDTADPNVQRILFAIFPFRLYADEVSWRRTSGWYRPDEDIDYGLLHEQGHQLGLIDLYQFNVETNQNQVTDEMYRTRDCLMNVVSPFLSPNSGYAMAHWADFAHGYYGQYLYNLPRTVRLRLLDSARRPISGARITMYQKVDRPGQGQVITNQIKAAGTTDARGEWTLPNVPIDTRLVPPTAIGDTLRPNPFGYIAVVGSNGTLLLVIEHQGQQHTRWIDLAEVNDLYWRGQRDVGIVERTLGRPRISPAEQAIDR